MSPTHHEPFKSLGPLAWEDVDTGDDTSLPGLFSTTFHNAQILVDSIPAPQTCAVPSENSSAPTTRGRARAKTESAVGAGYIPPASIIASSQEPKKDVELAATLRKDWKEVKLNPKDNPLGIAIYKLGAKDGKGSWFARRSVHSGLSFEKWRTALEREFAETLNRSDRKGSEPGTGNIRGIGAEKRVERKVVDGAGSLEMFQVSARFPGPTTPRDFITLLLMSPTTGDKAERKPRQFMLVSRPCTHPDCPPRQGFIRGVYESVEVIREIPIEKPTRKTRSSLDLSRSEVTPVLQLNDTELPARPSSAIDAEQDEEEAEFAIEWLMVTRSDPGGSVPRFMVEKGTPGGISNDANKFVRWISSTSVEELAGGSGNVAQKTDAKDTLEHGLDGSAAKATPDQETQPGDKGTRSAARRNTYPSEETAPSSLQTAPSAPQGFYGMISGALGAATSVVASTIGAFTGSARGTDSELDTETSDQCETDTDEDEAGYVSAEDWGDGSSAPKITIAATKPPGVGDDDASARSTRSATISTTTSSNTPPSISATTTKSKRAATISSQHEKELAKLQERRKKAEEKLARAQARRLEHASDKHKNKANSENDAEAKLRERHEKEMAKQEAKYLRELKKLEEKRLNEERKAAEKQRRQREKEEKANKDMELERVKAERDVALKEIEILKDQVGDLQGQNTKLVAMLGRAGLLPGDLGTAGAAGSARSSTASLDGVV
ncbi:reticulocyte-binding protein 2 a [Rhypophila decipiens]|uniref:Reticulocyte-binding protein 2 a n=1 Tax=Rhypophila decipiens TaxID=261697 RepID=A0AAN6YG98_9PEZI|nr:reticulocyte-binding protein 2 a [Rhypophila decipiens]